MAGVVNRHPVTPVPMGVTRDDLRQLQLYAEEVAGEAGAAGVASFNERTGAVELSAADIEAALGYVPAETIGSSGGFIPISIVDLPLADPDEPLIRWRFPVDVTLSLVSADASIFATSPSSLRFMRNGANNGVVTFTGGSGTGSITNGSHPAGTLIELYPPTTLDATLDRVSITLEIS